MKGLYGQDMIISRVKKNDYLGIMLDLLVRGKFAVTMVNYLKGVIYNLRKCKYSPGMQHHQPWSTFTPSERRMTRRNLMRNGSQNSIMLLLNWYLHAQRQEKIPKLKFIS